MFTYKVFVENIRRIIAEKGLKQCAVAKKAGFNEQAFSNMLNERKAIRATDVPAICAALGVEPNELYRVADERIA